jgi:hypothetical protein
MESRAQRLGNRLFGSKQHSQSPRRIASGFGLTYFMLREHPLLESGSEAFQSLSDT